MRTDDPARVDRVVARAEKKIDLAAIATGPADELGLGPEWHEHSELSFVLQGLVAFPGKGWPLIRAGLQSPVVNNRFKAMRVLAAWGRARWPDDAEMVVRRALKNEPDDELRGDMKSLLRS
jgi:hypothetical protein